MSPDAIAKLYANNTAVRELIDNCLDVLGLLEHEDKEVIDFEKFWSLWDNLPDNLLVTKGSKKEAKNRLEIFMSKFNFKYSDIIEKTKDYLKDCIAKNRFAKSPQFFIKEQNSRKDDFKVSLLYDLLTNESKEGYSGYDTI